MKSDAKIPGASLASTIKVLAGLGPIGEKVLKQNGISKIDPKKNYPSEIRLKIFEEVRERFGEDALHSIGIEQGLLMLSMLPPFGDYVTKFRKRDIKKSVSIKNLSKNYNLIEETLPGLVKITNDYMKQFRSKKLKGEIGFTRISENTWQMSSLLAQPTRNWPFAIGNYHIFLLSLFGDIFQISYQLDEENSSDIDEGWSKASIKVTFTPNKSVKDYKEVIANTRFEAHERLLKAVIEDAEKKKEHTEKLSSNLSKYLPPQIHEAIFSGKFDTEIATKRKKLTIFFSDISNFTSTSEGLQPEDLTRYLNEYFSEMTDIALKCGATIDKYIGDAMMVFFGDPDSKGEREDARDCVKMALKMRDRVSHLQDKWKKEGFSDPFQVRMGMNTGFCNVGNFGSEQRLTYTIIGSEVNVAQRLESSAESGGILLSYETFAHAQDLIEVEQLESISMKGVNRDIKVYSVLDKLVKKSHIKKNPKKQNSIRSVPERIGDRLNALESKIEIILDKIDSFSKQNKKEK